MDILSVLGIIVALASIVGGQHLEGGHLSSILQGTAFLIVIGGTLGAVMLQFPMSIFLRALGSAGMVFGNVNVDMKGIIAKIVELSNISRKQGLLALEGQMKTLTDPLMAKGVQLVVDGTEPHKIKEILEVEVEIFEEEYATSSKVYEAFGGYAPCVGIIGAVLGLIHVMENLADPSALGGGIAVAFVATVYGVGAANLIFLPMGNKIKLKTKTLIVGKMMVIEGLLSVAQGENPRMIEEKLSGFLPTSEKPKKS
ncbi:MAG: flagellar motor protein [Nitrospira sp.]|nr:flagellar motor protein [Nitrospira sp.]MCB9711373.1 flagellar motor protein [Nitrospiraceae bacterium]MDR4486309.1 flagellar motor protein [Nitrospirales bacterium]MCA9465811.1 flagellar motor protein [Nitrospira sp.]MCA9475493.1 flagellar motor protein [Nitrospira sp.]